MLPLGTVAPAFRLSDTTGKPVALDDFKDAPALVVIFMCNHCPYVKHIREGLSQFARDYLPRGVAIVGINSNDVRNYPADSPAKMAEEVASAGYRFPYLFDESQAVAQAYRAACTPDFYLFDGKPAARLPRTIRRQPTRQRFARHRPRPARRARSRARRQTGRHRSTTQHRLQHQVEARPRTGLRLKRTHPSTLLNRAP